MKDDRACPCGPAEHPTEIVNPPGRAFIRFRAGAFADFRRALLTPRTHIDPNTGQRQNAEIELSAHRPGPEGDLAVQTLEWWAYLADVLTFYNEQIANRGFVRTAGPGDVERLVRLLGYRPRPGLGARGLVGAIVQSKQPVALPAGLGLQSKPGPGEEPQIFTLDAETVVQPGGVIAAELVTQGLVGKHMFLRGSVSVAAGEELALVKNTWSGGEDGITMVKVAAVSLEKDPAGRAVTKISFEDPAPKQEALAHRLLRHSQTAHLWLHKVGDAAMPGVVASDTIHLDGVARSIRAGDPVLIRSVDGATVTQTLVGVSAYAETLWYANPKSANEPSVPPTGDKAVPIPVLHSVLTLSPKLKQTEIDTYDQKRGTVEVRYGFRPVGELIAVVASSAEASVTLAPSEPLAFPPSGQRRVLVEDATGGGAVGEAKAKPGAPGLVEVSFERETELAAPLRILTNLLAVSRGAEVPREVLGSGDARIAGQRFLLKKSPLTYDSVKDPAFPRGYRSSLRIRVDGVEWTEVERLHGQSPEARVFATREDADGKTWVLFGDGVRGARLPTGAGNVVASYRHGSGSRPPGPGALSVILTPKPGLTSVRGPVPPPGGTDPDPADKTRTLAPRSVFTFGRAVSAMDYEALASEAPGVTRSRAVFSWSAAEQRTRVDVFVTGDAGAADSARQKLSANSDPNRPVHVQAATIVNVSVEASVIYDPRRDPAVVLAAVRAALRDEETGLFGTRSLPIGAPVYESAIRAAAMAVPGVVAFRALLFKAPGEGPRRHPGEGKVFELPDEDLDLKMEKADAGV